MIRHAAHAALLALIAGPCLPAHAGQKAPADQGLVLEMIQTTPGAFAAEPFTMKITAYFSGKMCKHVIQGGGEIIHYLDRGKILIVDHDRKTYSEITPEELEKLLERGAAEFGDTEDNRTLRKLRGANPGTPAIARKGAAEAVAGQPTEKYLFKGPVQLEVWVAPALEAPEAYRDSLKLTMPRNPWIDMNRFCDELVKIPGVALKKVWTLKLKDKTVTATSVVTSVEKRPLPPSVFEVPADYQAALPPF